MLKGNCLCGTVSYEIHGDLSALLHCHCTFCRKSHGSSFATFGAVAPDGFSFVSGGEHLAGYSVSGRMTRNFCNICGSTMPFEEAGAISVPVGTLIDDCPTMAVGHIFVSSRAPWYEITDDLKQYSEFPASMARTPVPSRPPPVTGHLTGNCLCGDVGFETTQAPLGMMNCHCDRCKRSRSAAHATNLFVSSSGFRWMSGTDLVKQYKLPEAKRFGSAFCEHCGSLVPRVLPNADIINIPAGCLDGDPQTRPAAHIYTDNKANWFNITDNLQQYPQGRP